MILDSNTSGRHTNVDGNQNADLPTFYEITAEDLPPFGKKSGRFLCSKKYIAIFDLPATQNEPIFSVLISPNSTEITKMVLNNMLFVITSKVRKKRKNFKISRQSGRFPKTAKKRKIFRFIGRLGRYENVDD